MEQVSKAYCEKKSIEFMRKLADCKSFKPGSQDCINKIYKEYNFFFHECIVKKKYN